MKNPIERTDIAVVVIAYLKVKPEQQQAFLELAAQTRDRVSAKEEGCVSYTFYRDNKSENSIFFFEEWATQAAFEAHLNEPHTKELIDKYPELLEKSADIKIYSLTKVETMQIPARLLM